MIIKPNSGNINNMKDSPMNSNGTSISLQNIPSLKSSSSMVLGGPQPNCYQKRHISPFLQRSIDNNNNNTALPSKHHMQQSTSGHVAASYFQDDSDIRQVIDEIKRNENFENGMNYLTDYLEKHPGN